MIALMGMLVEALLVNKTAPYGHLPMVFSKKLNAALIDTGAESAGSSTRAARPGRPCSSIV